MSKENNQQSSLTIEELGPGDYAGKTAMGWALLLFPLIFLF